jgi:hypothetical protein
MLAHRHQYNAPFRVSDLHERRRCRSRGLPWPTSIVVAVVATSTAAAVTTVTVTSSHLVVVGVVGVGKPTLLGLEG